MEGGHEAVVASCAKALRPETVPGYVCERQLRKLFGVSDLFKHK